MSYVEIRFLFHASLQSLSLTHLSWKSIMIYKSLKSAKHAYNRWFTWLWFSGMKQSWIANVCSLIDTLCEVSLVKLNTFDENSGVLSLLANSNRESTEQEQLWRETVDERCEVRNNSILLTLRALENSDARIKSILSFEHLKKGKTTSDMHTKRQRTLCRRNERENNDKQIRFCSYFMQMLRVKHKTLIRGL